MPVSTEYINQELTKFFQDKAIWEIIDLAGDNNHYELIISSPLFAGKTRVMQHKMINEALKSCI